MSKSTKSAAASQPQALAAAAGAAQQSCFICGFTLPNHHENCPDGLKQVTPGTTDGTFDTVTCRRLVVACPGRPGFEESGYRIVAECHPWAAALDVTGGKGHSSIKVHLSDGYGCKVELRGRIANDTMKPGPHWVIETGGDDNPNTFIKVVDGATGKHAILTYDALMWLMQQQPAA